MVEHHGAPVAALPAGELHARVAGGHDRGAGAGGVVHARVHPHLAQHRVPARAVARTQPRVRDRHADEALLQRAPVQVEVLGLAVALEAQPGIGLAAGGEAGRQHLAAADPLAFAPGFLVDHAEMVAALGVAVEVDVVLEDAVGHRHDRARRQPGLAGGGVQRAVDGAAGDHGSGLDRALDHQFADGVAVERKLDPLAFVAVVAEHAQRAAFRQVERELRAGAQAGQGLVRAGLF
jgi:hypothetical protein